MSKPIKIVKIDKEEKDYVFKGDGLSGADKKLAHKSFDDYRNSYHITSYSDMLVLEELVYRESLQKRCKKEINDLEDKHTEQGKDKAFIIPSYVLDSMNENLNQIMELKKTLGLVESRNNSDGFAYIQQLKEKFKIWCDENQGSRTLTCPHCSKVVMLRIKTDAWEAQKHPFFKDKILANKKLWELFKTGKLTRKDIAEVLDCGEQYIDWLDKNIFKTEEDKNANTEHNG